MSLKNMPHEKLPFRAAYFVYVKEINFLPRSLRPMVPEKTNDLREDAYICPVNAMDRTTKSAICTMKLTVVG